MGKIKRIIFIMVAVLMFGLLPIYATSDFEVGLGWRLALQGIINWPTNYMGFMNEKNGITVGRNGECHYTIDGGKTWQMANNQSHCRYGIDTIGDLNAWSCGNYGHVRFTKDGGKNWGKLTDIGFSATLISFCDLSNGWIGSPSVNKIVATNDGGAQWSSIETPDRSNPISGISLVSAISGYVLTQGSEASVLYFTQDSGKSWQKLSTVCQGTLFSPTIRFFDNRQGIIIGCTKGKLVGFITADGGKTWQTENIFSKSCITFLTRDGKTLTIMNFIDNNYYVLVRE